MSSSQTLGFDAKASPLPRQKTHVRIKETSTIMDGKAVGTGSIKKIAKAVTHKICSGQVKRRVPFFCFLYPKSSLFGK